MKSLNLIILLLFLTSCSSTKLSRIPLVIVKAHLGTKVKTVHSKWLHGKSCSNLRDEESFNQIHFAIEDATKKSNIKNIIGLANLHILEKNKSTPLFGFRTLCIEVKGNPVVTTK